MTTPEKQVVEEHVEPKKQERKKLKIMSSEYNKKIKHMYYPAYKSQIPYPQRLKQTKQDT